MHDYRCFLTNFKASFDSSKRVRLHTDLWLPCQKLLLFDTDSAMKVLLPFYSFTSKLAKNQLQILRSFLLFFFLVSLDLTPPSLSLWVSRLSRDRLLSALIGCPLDSLTVSGGGTAVHTHADLYEKHTKEQIASLSLQALSTAPWHYSDPDVS